MKTVSIYQKTPSGEMVRIGTFTSKGHSIRSIGDQFMSKHPNCDPKSLFVAARNKILGAWVDGNPIKVEAEGRE